MCAITPSRAVSFTSGELARLANVNVETIRYYERIGMLAAPPRTEGGRRAYGTAEVKTLTFIRRSRELGFSIDEIRNLLGLAKDGHACGEVKAAALSHLGSIRGKIADLRRMERTLAKTAALCEGGDAPRCPILDALSE
ncbi:MerR family transcriptional regulator [Bosea vaviloviae]|uniref:Transcriptional regulator n=1 Tax=Bosea vaviloviae TaxID=1526658 RepID=A0A0N1FDR5_9HYPH|nr:helix-turn-helix domain-containing protein [Bosea vaviloviae]KPH77370.1 transcriptional regulator [Bosea vaviloviae]